MTTNVLLVFPQFPHHSFWSFRSSISLLGARAFAPPLGLLTVAALLPREWSVRLVNKNTDTLTDADLAWADIVMTGGMLTQRLDTLAVIDLCHAHDRLVVVGGPDATSCPDEYASADFLVLGEAEGVLSRFTDAWASGATSGVFEAPKFSIDVTTSPIPRFDLLTFNHYLCIGVQFSRGCPFTCEFCDIIELYGRVPRAKSIEQMLGELDTLYRAGHRGHVDFVDDNFIGNKKALKLFLPALIDWQQARRYPFRFSTEASINLADDAELLRMMKRANFFVVFVGIESSNTDTLVSAQKRQNTRRDLVASVHTLYRAGLAVIAGFIVGFDTEQRPVADEMADYITASSIAMCMAGLLTALPNTQLTRRLQREGRLLPFDPAGGDQCSGGLNFTTLRPRREILMDYRRLLAAIYEPAAYFGRVQVMDRLLNPSGPASRPSWRAWFRLGVAFLRFSGRVLREPAIGRYAWRVFAECVWRRPGNLEAVMLFIGAYLHLGSFVRFLLEDLDRKIQKLEEDAHVDATPIAHRAAG